MKISLWFFLIGDGGSVPGISWVELSWVELDGFVVFNAHIRRFVSGLDTVKYWFLSITINYAY